MTTVDTARLAVLIDADNAQPPDHPGAARRGRQVRHRARQTRLRRLDRHQPPRLEGPARSPNRSSRSSSSPTPPGKNATDAAMVIDAMDLLYSNRFDGFCIVSSDSDFTRLAARLRESGLTVYGFGERKTPKPFVAACDKFIYTENLTTPRNTPDGETDPPSRTRTPRPTTPLKADTALAEALPLTRIEAASDEDGWAPLAIGRPHHHQTTTGLRLPNLRLQQTQRASIQAINLFDDGPPQPLATERTPSSTSETNPVTNVHTGHDGHEHLPQRRVRPTRDV